jgi:hypothetical protein
MMLYQLHLHVILGAWFGLDPEKYNAGYRVLIRN